ncbi:MAG TPA: STAS domain-containing protein [Pseudonocardiaceae bacterium]|nr:STAS domain-containing protein [Pseudonocardiaceae bacterium]
MAEQDGTAVLTISSSVRDGIVVVSLVGELDMSTADDAAVALREATVSARAVVVDMTGLRFFASAGVNVLLQLRRDMDEKGVTVRLVADQRAVLRPLELMGMADLFLVHVSVADALAAAGT